MREKNKILPETEGFVRIRRHGETLNNEVNISGRLNFFENVSQTFGTIFQILR